jgi:valine dehydrogenase (NAD+)
MLGIWSMTMTIAKLEGIPASARDGFEQIVIQQDTASGMRLIVAVHSTVLGPALGGMRLKAYPGGLREALDDVKGLARTMTLKASAAGLDLGGGKAVMLDDGQPQHHLARMEAAARVIESLGGTYITAEDIGTTTADMDHVARFTRFCTGRSFEHGGRGDPSPVTAETVLRAMRRGLAARLGSDELDGRSIGVIGLGKVGGALAARLSEAGARVVACDIDSERCERYAAEHGVQLASAEAILAMELDVLAPCAGGGLIDERLARALQVGIVAGAANNPLTGPLVAEELARRGVLYVPDFLANCGGLIHVAGEWFGDDELREQARIEHAMDRLDSAIAGAAAEGGTPVAVAERQALERVAAARR